MMNATQPLSLDSLQKIAPSVFADHAFEKVSARYRFVSTLEMIETLDRVGWQPVEVQVSRSRDDNRRAYAKHLLRFRRFDDQLPMLGDSLPEIVVLNSHDGSCAYRMHAGLFRLVCTNGMIVANTSLGQICLRHTGEAAAEIVTGVQAIVAALPTIAGKVRTFGEVRLQPDEQHSFASTALNLRWDEGKAPIKPSQLLQARRLEDRRDDLWSTYQRIQENLIKGGQRGIMSNGRRMMVRAVQSVDSTVRINQGLWQLTEHMADCKAA